MAIQPLTFAKGQNEISLLPGMANRHGLIAGATGTGKTISLQVLSEHFSDRGVPVFLADVKGDLAGISQAGGQNPKVQERVQKLALTDWSAKAYPVVFWDVFGELGHPVRATISEMGPLLLSRILNLNATQEGVLNIVFKVADDNGLLLLDLKDLRAMLEFVSDHAAEVKSQYGNVSAASVGAIQRGLLTLEQQGAEQFFGEPALDLNDLIQTANDGRGIINILQANKLVQSPKLYATFLLWLLSELFENLPEVGDPEKPVLVFFFDEAHLLFEDAPKELLDKIEQVVRLIRSKGVGVYFVTQNPLDVPDDVLGQLGNKVQHALRAFTPKDQKAVRAAAQTFRENPGLDVEAAILELAVGEGLISVLDPKGTPTPVERAFVFPPQSKIGPITPEETKRIIQSSVLFGHYEKAVDRESAYERLKQKASAEPPTATPTQPQYTPPQQQPTSSGGGFFGTLGTILGGTTGPRGGHREGIGEAMAKSAARSIGSAAGRQILRGVLGSLLGGSTSSRRRY
ncbi:MAG TPA: helicase HerA-like domain-containing protein [Terriglobales bacterium]|nr:helicase HerA-like domain-containing protein [Terriglobales bacterium]